MARSRTDNNIGDEEMPIGIVAGGGLEEAPAGAPGGAAGEPRPAPVPPARAPAGADVLPEGAPPEAAVTPHRPEGTIMKRPRIKCFTCKGWGHSYRDCPSGGPHFWRGGRGGRHSRRGHGGHRGGGGGKTTNVSLKFF